MGGRFVYLFVVVFFEWVLVLVFESIMLGFKMFEEWWEWIMWDWKFVDFILCDGIKVFV